MAEPQKWRESLHDFFHLRGDAIEGAPSHEDLCYIAGRDPRVWMDPAIRLDLAQSILELSGATAQSSVLEVGSAAGFLAQLVAPRVASFTGVDLAEGPLKVARRLGLANARFQKADGESLPFEDASFDCVFCYDVFTNFPAFDDGEPLIREMLRVVKPGGRVLIGSIPDSAESERFQQRVAEVSAELDRKFGPPAAVPVEEVPGTQGAGGGWLAKLFRTLRGDKVETPVPVPVTNSAVRPEIVCYEFAREDFRELGRRLGIEAHIRDIHSMNPYHGFRFNAVFTRGS